MGKYALVVALLVGLNDSAFARDDGRYANELLKNWFDNLTSSNGEWINVPNSSIVTEPNRYGPAVVWPYMDSNGTIYIRCFLPGAGA